MTLDKILSKMFPADPNRGYPCFVELNLDQCVWLDDAIRQPIEKSLSHHAEKLAGLSDINDQLKVLQLDCPNETKKFLSAAIEAYFSSAQVSVMLRGGMATLFPNDRPLAEIDTDLLEPVFNLSLGAWKE